MHRKQACLLFWRCEDTFFWRCKDTKIRRYEDTKIRQGDGYVFFSEAANIPKKIGARSSTRLLEYGYLCYHRNMKGKVEPTVLSDFPVQSSFITSKYKYSAQQLHNIPSQSSFTSKSNPPKTCYKVTKLPSCNFFLSLHLTTHVYKHDCFTVWETTAKQGPKYLYLFKSNLFFEDYVWYCLGIHINVDLLTFY